MASSEVVPAVPAAASTAITALITGSVQPAEIIADFPVARYLRVDAAVIALLTPAAVRLPNALVCRELPPVADCKHGVGAVLVGDGCVQLGTTRVTVGRWWDPVPRLPAVVDPRALGRTLDVARLQMPDWPDSGDMAAEQLVTGRQALTLALAGEGASGDAADGLVGLGSGLTPAGDDLLAGAVAGLVLFGRAMGRAASVNLGIALAGAAEALAARTTILAADLGRHAASGAVAEPIAAVCHALSGQQPFEPAMERLLAVGHTSGRDLAEGLLLGVHAAL